MASSGSPLLRHLFNSLVKAVTEVKELKEEKKEYDNCSRDRSYSVTSIDSGYFEGSGQGKNTRLHFRSLLIVSISRLSITTWFQ